VSEGFKRKKLEPKGSIECTWVDEFQIKCKQEAKECQKTKNLFSRKKLLRRVVKTEDQSGFIVKVFYSFDHLTEKCYIEVSVEYTLLVGY